jgi:hypothetical protein
MVWVTGGGAGGGARAGGGVWASSSGKTRNYVILVRPCDSVTPTIERVRSNTYSKNTATANTNTTSKS